MIAKRTILMGVMSWLVLFPLQERLLAQDEDVRWSQELIFDRLPSEFDQRWRGLGEGKSFIQDNHLVIDTEATSSGGDYVWRIEGDIANPYWDASRPTTVEFKCRVQKLEGGKENAAHIVVADSRKYYCFQVGREEWTTYRVLINDGLAELYCNNEATPAQTSAGSPLPEGANSNHFYFGDAGDEIGGTTEWLFLRWTNDGSFPPSPSVR